MPAAGKNNRSLRGLNSPSLRPGHVSSPRERSFSLALGLRGGTSTDCYRPSPITGRHERVSVARTAGAWNFTRFDHPSGLLSLSYNIEVIPEPAAGMLVIAGAGALLGRRRTGARRG